MNSKTNLQSIQEDLPKFYENTDYVPHTLGEKEEETNEIPIVYKKDFSKEKELYCQKFNCLYEHDREEDF